ncbi:nicotinate-nucleotide adenylyltransferase [Verrucomicrobiota bacterium]
MDLGEQNRIGILGGTFNPVHVGHLILAQCAFESLDLSRVLFVPCAVPPHKDPHPLLPARHRLAMIESAVEGDLRFEVTDIEIRREGVSYAIDTVSQLRKDHPDAALFFIIGSDTLRELRAWKRIDALLSLCTFATFARPGFDFGDMDVHSLGLSGPGAERLMRNITAGRQIEISSSDIRYRIAEGMSIRYLVPPSVEMYIIEHGLYRT